MDINQKCKNCGHTKEYHLPELERWKQGIEETPKGKNLQGCKYPGCDCMKFESIKCTECGSENIFETGVKGGLPMNKVNKEAIDKSLRAAKPLYQCKDCGEQFFEEIE